MTFQVCCHYYALYNCGIYISATCHARTVNLSARITSFSVVHMHVNLTSFLVLIVLFIYYPIIIIQNDIDKFNGM